MFCLLAGAAEQRRSRIAVVKFENTSKHRDEVPVEHPSLEPSVIPLLGSDSSGSLAFGTKRPVERYSANARLGIETLLLQWEDHDLLDRSREEVIEAEMARSRDLGGNLAITGREEYQRSPHFLVLGTIRDVWNRSSTSVSFGVSRNVQETLAEISIRVLKVPGGDVVFETSKIGSFALRNTPFVKETSSDPEMEAIRSAVAEFANDESFRRVFRNRLSARSGTSPEKVALVEVLFEPAPSNCVIEIDGHYVGQSPLSRALTLGKEHIIRFTQPRHKSWESVIVVESGLLIRPSLIPLQ